MRASRISLAFAALLLAVVPAAAQMSHDAMQHGTMQHGATPGAKGAAETPATTALKAAAARMHRDMAIAYSGDADVDFVRGMIPHHQAAIDMARIELQYGKDEATRAVAQSIVKAQEAEIAEMQAWLKSRGH